MGMFYQGSLTKMDGSSTFDLLVPISLDELIFILKMFLPFLITYPNEEVNCTEPFLSVSIPGFTQ